MEMLNRVNKDGLVLNEKQLQDICSELMEMMWGEKLEIPVKINSRLTRTFAWFKGSHISLSDRIPLKIEVSKRLLNGNYKFSTIENILKHELCHYYLFKNYEPYADGCKRFEDELVRIGSYSTRKIISVEKIHGCKCKTCNALVGRFSKKEKAMSTISRCISKCCRGKLEYVNLGVTEDTTKEIKTKYTVISKYISGSSSDSSNVIKNNTNKNICTDKNLKIEDIVVLKRSKVSQQNVWDAMLLEVEEQSPEKLRLIKQHYPELFNKICLFIGKKRVEYINSVI